MKIKAFLFLFITSTHLVYAQAYTRAISFEDFVSSNKDQQRAIIRLIHKFLIEYENQSTLKRTEKSDKKYHSFIKIMNHFIHSAYGLDTPSTSRFNQHKCYYAGWVSFTKVDENSGETYCVHPKRITYQENLNYLKSLNDPILLDFYQNKVSQKYKKYFGGRPPGTTSIKHINIDSKGDVTLKDGQDNCSSGESIACNPEIYGTHKLKAQSVSLCVNVSATGNYGLNASFACDKALEHLKQNRHDLFLEHMESIIDPILKDRAKESPPIELLNSMYDTCLCKGETGLTNKAYSEKIFLTRTCASILSQTQNIYQAVNRACSEKSQALDNFPLVDFLNRANRLLNDEIEILRNIPFPDKSNQKAHREKIKKYFRADQELYKEIAEKNYQEAKRLGLCPIGAKRPMLSPAIANSVFELEEQPEEENSPEAITQISCEIKLSQNKTSLEVLPNLDDIEDLSLEDMTPDMIGSIMVENEGANITAKKDKLLIYSIENYNNSKEIKVSGHINLSGIKAPIACSKDKIHDVKQATQFGKCEIQLKQVPIKETNNKAQAGTYKVVSSIKFYKDAAGKEEVSQKNPEFAELFKSPLKPVFTWFDQSEPKSNNLSLKDQKSKKFRRNPNALDSDEELDEDGQEEETIDQKITDASTKRYKSFAERFAHFRFKNAPHKGNQLLNIRPREVPRKITAMAMIQKDGKNLCEGKTFIEASTTVKADTSGFNGNPAQNTTPTQFAPGPRGKVIRTMK